MSVDALGPRARKPLFGRERALTRIARAFRSNRPPSSWSFEGRFGVGKASLAHRLARAILAGGPFDGDLEPPEEDRAARLAAQGAHPDLLVLEPGDGASGEIGVDSTREALGRLRSTSAMGGARVLVIDPVDRLNRNAANALLKFLEEPPDGAFVLGVAHRPPIATFASRCARLRLAPLNPGAMAAALGALGASDLDPELIEIAAGSPGLALELRRLGFAERYRAVARALDEPGLAGALAAEKELSALASAGSLADAAALLEHIAARSARRALGFDRASGSDPCALAGGEAGGPAARARLEALANAHHRIGALAARSEALRLDRRQTILRMIEALENGARSA